MLQTNKWCIQNQNTFLFSIIFPSKIVPFMKKCGKIWYSQTYNNTAHTHCMLNNYGFKHTLRICNTRRFSTTTIVAWKRPIVMFIRTLPVSLMLYSYLRPISLQQKWVTGIFPGGKGGQCVGLTAVPTSCADCLEIKSSNLMETSVSVQTCTGIALPFYLRPGLPIGLFPSDFRIRIVYVFFPFPHTCNMHGSFRFPWCVGIINLLRMPRNRLTRIPSNYRPTGRRNKARPWKRHLRTAQQVAHLHVS